MEAESVALSMAMQDLLPLKRLVQAFITGVGLQKNNSILYEDPNTMMLWHITGFRAYLKPEYIRVLKVESKQKLADTFQNDYQRVNLKLEREC